MKASFVAQAAALFLLLAIACGGAGGRPPAIGQPSPGAAQPAPTAAPASPNDGMPAATPQPRPAAGVLTDLRSLEDLKARFNQDRGTPRLILLFSPT